MYRGRGYAYNPPAVGVAINALMEEIIEAHAPSMWRTRRSASRIAIKASKTSLKPFAVIPGKVGELDGFASAPDGLVSLDLIQDALPCFYRSPQCPQVNVNLHGSSAG